MASLALCPVFLEIPLNLKKVFSESDILRIFQKLIPTITSEHQASVFKYSIPL